MKTLNCSNKELSIIFINDQAIQKLNRQYRQINRPTDVLSFTIDSPLILGDIAVSLPTARKQAQELKHSLENEVTFLIIHGILHILGHDHEKINEYKKMRKMEVKLYNISSDARDKK